MLKKKTNFNRRKSILFGIIILLLGISLFSYDYFQSKKSYAFEYMNNKLYLSSSEMPDFEEDEKGVVTEDVTNDKEVTKEKIKENVNKGNTSNQSTYYIGYLEIPKVKVKKGFVDINSRDNQVGKNITIISGSQFPNVDKGNFIIAGHSGTGVHSYFKNLYKLSKGDKAYVYYDNVKYTYEIVKIYNQKKDGTIAIYRDYNETTLTLITCTKDNKKSQTVYIAELVAESSY